MQREYVFDLLSYNDAISQSKVLNECQISNYIYLKIPKHISADMYLHSVCKLGINTPIDYSDEISRECRRCWLKVQTSLLDLTPGYHCYKFEFVNTKTCDMESFYFAYKLQSDNPDKPYVYMDRGE